jgi:hypothetical protein
MGDLFSYEGPVRVWNGSRFICDAYLSLKSTSRLTNQATFQGNITAASGSDILQRYACPAVLSLEMYNGSTLDFNIEADGTIHEVRHCG